MSRNSKNLMRQEMKKKSRVIKNGMTKHVMSIIHPSEGQVVKINQLLNLIYFEKSVKHLLMQKHWMLRYKKAEVVDISIESLTSRRIMIAEPGKCISRSMTTLQNKIPIIHRSSYLYDGHWTKSSLQN